jgi:hypothetical protein
MSRMVIQLTYDRIAQLAHVRATHALHAKVSLTLSAFSDESRCMGKATAVVMMLALASTASADEVAPTTTADEETVVDDRTVPTAMFISFSAIAVASLGVYFYAGHAISEAEPRIADELQATGATITEDDCGNDSYRAMSRSFDSACSWTRRSAIAMPVALITIPAAIISGYFAFRSQPKKEKRSVALIPTVTTQTAGAMLDVRW